MTDHPLSTTCFRAYDIRGLVPDELNEDLLAYRLGQAFAAFLKPQKVVVGQDMRLSSRSLAATLSR